MIILNLLKNYFSILTAASAKTNGTFEDLKNNRRVDASSKKIIRWFRDNHIVLNQNHVFIITILLMKEEMILGIADYELSKIKEFFHLQSVLELFALNSEAEELSEMSFIVLDEPRRGRKRPNRLFQDAYLDVEFLTSLSKNESPIKQKDNIKIVSSNNFIRRVNRLLERMEFQDENTIEKYVKTYVEIAIFNKDIEIVSKCNALFGECTKGIQLCVTDRYQTIMNHFLICRMIYYFSQENTDSSFDLINEFDDKVNGDVLLNLVNEFETGNHPLLKEKLVEISQSELKERLIVKLIPTQKFYKEFLPELINQFDRFKFLQIEKTDSAEFDEEFFYPEEIQKELALIEDLINSGVQKLTVFLSGDPGVGKTSFVRFLAKKLGKNLISNKSVKSKWFGESQSNLEEMFNQFQIVQKQLEIAPIFFIDEADSLLSKRVNPGENLSDTLNEMQGILLRKIENFRGILICATNFPISRFDSAFERRFDIILEMKTNENAKTKMLESKKLNLSKDEIKELASNKKLTPAIIQLILKKKGLYESASLDFCFKNEVEKRLNTNISSNSIGFIK